MNAIDELSKQVMAHVDHVDYLINNAGRSIRRAVHESYDRFHDFERTMQLNYFGAVRLVLNLLPHMIKRKMVRSLISVRLVFWPMPHVFLPMWRLKLP